MPVNSPPFTITTQIITLISRISEGLGRLSVLQEQKDLRLRRINRIRTIQGSLAIEGNTLSEAQITAILEGKRVIAPPKDILEARNAIKAYEQFEQWQPAKARDLLNAHGILMAGLIDDAGYYRAGNVGVMNGEKVVHMAPQADRVPMLMDNLLQWLNATDQHPLIASSVFHYEFEFIHPFADGNGRMGRLWQTLILNQWNPLFAQLPVESMVHEYQAEYYQAINQSTQQTDSSPFIEFMLNTILHTIESSVAPASEASTPQVTPQVSPQDSPQVTPQEHKTDNPQISALLNVLQQQQTSLNREQLQQALNLKDRKSFRARYLKPALDAGLIEMTIPDKPNSKYQRYRLVE